MPLETVAKWVAITEPQNTIAPAVTMPTITHPSAKPGATEASAVIKTLSRSREPDT